MAIAALHLAGLVWQTLSQFSDIVLLFFLAWVIAFILEPSVVFLHHHMRVPRAAAVTVVYLGTLLLIVGGMIWLVPPLSKQVTQVVTIDLHEYAGLVDRYGRELQQSLEERGIILNLEAMFNYDELARRAEAMASPIFSNAVALASSIATFFFQLAVVLMLSFYVMLDYHRISRGLIRVVPRQARADVVFFFASVNRAFAGFLRGQLIQAVIYAVGVGVIMWAFNLDLVLLTAVVGTICMLVPFVGPPLALVMPLVVAWIERPDAFLWICLLINVHQQIVLNVVAPRVMSTAIGLHPLLVFVGILGGARVAGVWGALFGVPVVAVIAAMIQFYHHMIEERRHGHDGEPDPRERPDRLEPARAPRSVVREAPVVGAGSR